MFCLAYMLIYIRPVGIANKYVYSGVFFDRECKNLSTPQAHNTEIVFTGTPKNYSSTSPYALE